MTYENQAKDIRLYMRDSQQKTCTFLCPRFMGFERAILIEAAVSEYGLLNYQPC